jgi:hypothetical protein
MTTKQQYIDATRGGAAGLLTSDIPTGLAGDQLVSETFSQMVYSRTFETGLVALVNKVDAASAYRCRYITGLPDVEAPGEGQPYSFGSDFVFAQERAALQTFTSATVVSNELMADYALQPLLAQVLAGQLAEQLNGQVAARVGVAVGGTARHNRGTATGTLTGPLLTRTIFGQGVTANSVPAGQMFSNADMAGLVIASNGTVFGEMIVGGFQTSYPADLQDFRDDRGQASFAGLPWHFVSTMPISSLSTTISNPHVIIFDPRYVSLAMQPLVIRTDSESLAENNQTVIHASVRAEAFLGGISHAAAISIKAII